MSTVLRQLAWVAALSGTTGLLAEAATAMPATSEPPAATPDAAAANAPTAPAIAAKTAALSVSTPETIAPISPASRPNPAIATQLQQIAQYGNASQRQGSANVAALDQVTSVSQLSDVKPTDWAFQALQSLVERYGCIVGYPDKTFRGNRALTPLRICGRFECLHGSDQRTDCRRHR